MRHGKQLGAMDFIETGNWNVAQSFSQTQIMQHFDLISQYQTIAEYGTSEFIEEFIVDEQMKTKARIKGLDRMAFHILIVIENSFFGLKDKYKEEVLNIKADVTMLKGKIPMVKSTKKNQRDKKEIIVINEEIFKFIFDKLCLYKMQLFNPLNKSNMIFLSAEDLNEDELKDKYADEILNSG